ncbi:MAG: ROK family protein [Candidatus Omnitrophica bacterium]|jgi:glucokinase|nr:ROK family protein [Candidatus Omnitrophota bacterium]
MGVFLGIDWGGTYIKAGLVDSQGKIIRSMVYTSADLRKKKVFIDKLISLVKEFKTFKIKGVGIGAPGIINREKGFIYYLPNIPGWKNFPLGNILKKELKIPVFIDNDANVFALAESRYGAAYGLSRAIFLTLGTGLGGAVISGGEVLKTEVSALELGHVPISLEKRPCGCGGQGCIETFIGSKYLLARYRKLKNNNTKAKNIKDIFDKASRGEKEALLVWEEFSFALGMFLAGMINIFNPQAIIFGGGVSGAFPIFKPKVWQVIKKQAMWPQLKGLKLVKAKVKEAGLTGAALLAAESIKIKNK